VLAGSVRFRTREAKRIADLADLVAMGVSLHDATGGRIHVSDLNYLVRMRQWQIERANMAQTASEGNWKRVG
jgi:hypothetical protein